MTDKISPPNIETLPPNELRARYRELRAWYVATLRGNNYDINEDEMFHQLVEEIKADTGERHAAILGNGPCPLAKKILDYDEAAVKHGKTSGTAEFLLNDLIEDVKEGGQE